MLQGKKAKGKMSLAPAIMNKQEAKNVLNPLFEKRPKNFSIGRDIQPKRDLTCFVKWHCYIRLNTVTTLVENKKAQLIVTACNRDPIELVVFLLAMCRMMGVPYCIIKGKARLGQLVHKKTCTTVAFTQVNSKDKGALAKLVEAIRTNYHGRYDETSHHMVGNILDLKSVTCIAKLEKAKAKELTTKLG
ncbi:hypothetical protein A6R68_02073 [Neotoma lepida]|uniref:60S ribosomal protein L7a n=1 Tax=Neotoma lepida TaxID=56216 RepID=A0A1A6GVL3_NEOLE|nr:hypothetical protein A6R68_02073 [Neotoma lepida]